MPDPIPQPEPQLDWVLPPKTLSYLPLNAKDLFGEHKAQKLRDEQESEQDKFQEQIDRLRDIKEESEGKGIPWSICVDKNSLDLARLDRIIAIVKGSKHLTSIRASEIASGFLDDTGFDAMTEICKLAATLPTLSSFTANGNALPLDVSCFASLAQCSSLKALEIGDGGFGSRAGKQVFELLLQMANNGIELEKLVIVNARLGTDGPACVDDVLVALRARELRNSHGGHDPVAAEKGNTFKREHGVSGVITDEMLKEREGRRNRWQETDFKPEIEQKRLSSNLGEVIGMAIDKHAGSLRVLVLEACDLDAKVIVGILTNLGSPLPLLQVLSMADHSLISFDVDDDGSESNTIVTLTDPSDGSKEKINVQAVFDYAHALERMPRLEQLSLASMNLDYSVTMGMILKPLSQGLLKSLRCLNLEGNDGQIAALDALHHAVAQGSLPALQFLKMDASVLESGAETKNSLKKLVQAVEAQRVGMQVLVAGEEAIDNIIISPEDAPELGVVITYGNVLAASMESTLYKHIKKEGIQALPLSKPTSIPRVFWTWDYVESLRAMSNSTLGEVNLAGIHENTNYGTRVSSKHGLRMLLQEHVLRMLTERGLGGLARTKDLFIAIANILLDEQIILDLAYALELNSKVRGVSPGGGKPYVLVPKTLADVCRAYLDTIWQAYFDKLFCLELFPEAEHLLQKAAGSKAGVLEKGGEGKRASSEELAGGGKRLRKEEEEEEGEE